MREGYHINHTVVINGQIYYKLAPRRSKSQEVREIEHYYDSIGRGTIEGIREAYNEYKESYEF